MDREMIAKTNVCIASENRKEVWVAYVQRMNRKVGVGSAKKGGMQKKNRVWVA